MGLVYRIYSRTSAYVGVFPGEFFGGLGSGWWRPGPGQMVAAGDIRVDHWPPPRAHIPAVGRDRGRPVGRRLSSVWVVRIRAWKLGWCWFIVRWSAAGPGRQSRGNW